MLDGLDGRVVNEHVQPAEPFGRLGDQPRGRDTSVMSPPSAIARPPSRLIRSASACATSKSMSWIATAHPADASARAIPSPIRAPSPSAARPGRPFES